MTPPKPRADVRSDEQRIADLERSIDLYGQPRPAQGGTAARAAIARATKLACMVRDEGTDGIGVYLDDLIADPDAVYATLVALAAMVPVDQPVDTLLGWVVPLGEELERTAERERKRVTAAARRQDAAA